MRQTIIALKKRLFRILPITLLVGVLVFQTNVVKAANTHSAQFVRASSQSLSAADSTDISITGNMTLEADIKINNDPTNNQYYTIISKRGGATTQSYVFYYANVAGTKRFATYISSTGDNEDVGLSAANALTAGDTTWYHVSVVYTAATPQFEYFVNCSSIGTVAAPYTSIHDNASPLVIGAINTVSPANFFDGKIDNVRVYNTTRTGAQICGDYQTELVGNEAGLKAYYLFNGSSLEDKGTSTDPAGSVADDLTNNNAVTFVTDVPFAGGGAVAVARIDDYQSATDALMLVD